MLSLQARVVTVTQSGRGLRWPQLYRRPPTLRQVLRHGPHRRGRTGGNRYRASAVVYISVPSLTSVASRENN